MASWAKIQQNNPPESTPAPVTPTSKAGPKSGLFRVLLRVLPIIIIISAFIIAIFLFIYTHITGWQGILLLTTVPLGDVLLLCTAACKIVFTAVPLVMAAAAYPIADAWRKRSDEFNEEHPEYQQASASLPSRPQHAIMSEVFTAANISAVLKASLFLWRAPEKTQEEKPKEKKEKDALSRDTLKKTVITLISLLITAYLIFLVDLILHGVSKAVQIEPPPSNADPLAGEYGRVLRPECSGLDPQTQRPCTIDFQPGGMFNATYIEAAYVKQYPEAMSIFTGTSSSSRVVSVPYEDKDVAVLVPADEAITPGSSYSAPTVGMYTSCVPMTQTCDFVTPCTTCEGKAPCNMSQYPSIDAFASGINPHGVLKRHVVGSNSWDYEFNGSNGTDVNPYVFLFSGIFNIGYPKSTPGLYDDTTWGKGSNTTLSTVLLICSLTAIDATVHYSGSNSTFTIESLAPTANNGTVRAISSIIDMQQSPFEQFFDILEPLASASIKVDASTGTTTSSGTFIKSFQKALGTTYLPFAHSAFVATPATGTTVQQEVIGAAVPIVWLVIYMILLAIFVGIATYQAIMSIKVHAEAKWRERKEENKHEESGNEKKPKEKDEAKGTAESFTDPMAMTYEESDDKKAGPGAKENGEKDPTGFGAFPSDSMASLTSAMKGRTFGQPSQ